MSMESWILEGLLGGHSTGYWSGYTGGKGEHTHTGKSIKELLINQEAIHFGV